MSKKVQVNNRLLYKNPYLYSFGGNFKEAFGKLNGSSLGSALGGAAGGLGSMAGGMVGGLLSNGFESTAGNVFNTVGDIAGAIPGPWGAIASAGAKILGGLTNAAFGTKVDQEKLNLANQGTSYLNNFTSDASSFDEIQGPEAVGQVGDVYKGGWFAKGKARRKNEELMNKRLLALDWANRSVENNIDNIDADQMNSLLANYAAFGGPLHTNGADWSNGVITVDSGGTHESNPYEGVQMGIAPDGEPNLVEEGEVIFNDYVFSNRMRVPDAVRQKYKLRGAKDMTFADAAKRAQKESEERPNDPISQRGLEDIMNKLMVEQELMRQKQTENSYAKGGKVHKFVGGGATGNSVYDRSIIDWLNEHYSDMADKEEMAAVLQNYINSSPSDSFFKGSQSWNKNRVYERALSDINGMSRWRSTTDYSPKRVQERKELYDKLIGLGMSKRNAFNRAYPEIKGNNYPGSVKKRNELYKEYVGEDVPTSQSSALGRAIDALSPVAAMRRMTPIGSAGTNFSTYAVSDGPLISQERIDAINNGLLNGLYGGNADKINAARGIIPSSPVATRRAGNRAPLIAPVSESVSSFDIPENRNKPSVYSFNEDPFKSFNHVAANNTEKVQSITPEVASSSTQEVVGTNNTGNNKGSWLTGLRYVPAVGAGIGVFSDLMGWTNRPDYSNAQLTLDAANRIGRVNYNPIGDYMRYNPLDRMFYANQLGAQAAATRRNILNTSGGNRGAAMAGLLAADYNAQNQLGNLYRQAEEYNLGQRERVANFNRATNMFNAENDMKAQIANRDIDKVRVDAAAKAAALRDAVDARVSAARSANLTNLFDSLGDIGREEFSRNMINSNPAFPYSISRRGIVGYNPSHSKGGYLTVKKRRKR